MTAPTTAPIIITAKPDGPAEGPTVVRRSLLALAPRFGLAVGEALNRCWWDGLDAVVFEAERTDERQAWLYAQGRTRAGQIVTNAKSARNGWHWYCLAVDVISKSRGWDVSTAWRGQVTAHFKAAGCKWGGDWPSFRDLPHYQWGALKSSPSPRAAELYALGRTEGGSHLAGLERVWDAVGAR